MSYALRNTLILLVALLLIGGGAFSYLKFVQESQINELSTELEALNKDYTSKVSIRDQYQDLLVRYNKAREIVLGYDKQLFDTNNPDDVYNYLSEINDVNLELYYDFNFQDSVIQNQYGVLESRIVGTGIYSDFITFVNKIENSMMLNKIQNVSITPATGAETDDYIDFSMSLNSYYKKIEFDDDQNESERFRVNPLISVYNPLKPLILNSIPINVDNLINIEQSRLLGLTSTRIFIVDQTGENQILRPGDKVYLGYLKEINVQQREVIFSLDKGGITEQFTLKVER
ncbi:MAG: hypothetical protein ABJR05_15950 [Balneola sp.]